MLRRAAIVIVVMLNLGAAGWWWLQPVVPASPAVVAADAPTLHLVGETARVVPASATTTPTAPVAPPATPVVAAATPPPVQVCLRFGPFAHPAARDAARARLLQADVSAQTHDSPAKDVRGWKVFLPAQASRDAALALADKIKASGLTDLFVMTQGDAVNSIALGRFGSEAAAQRRQAEVVSKGFAAQVAAVGGTPAQHWLDARLPQTANRVNLVRIATAQPLDCSALR